MMQPYAWLFAKGFLTVDDRTWSTRYRGEVAIHASKRFHAAYYGFLRENTDWPLPRPEDFDFGGVVGTALLTDCRAPLLPAGARLTTIDLRRSHFGAPGHYGLAFANPREAQFYPCPGNRGLFDLPWSPEWKKPQ